MSGVRVKVCCIADVDEAKLAIRYGASALGLVSEMPSGPGVIDEPMIAEIAATIPPGVASVLLTCQQSPEKIIAQQRRTRVNTIQLCDELETDAYARLRDAMPGVSLMQVIHVTGRASVDEAIAVSRQVNALLLDSGNPSLAIKELGGTGRRHDWSLSREIVASVKVPVFLAGGLNPENVVDAIARVRPFSVDACSGLRTNGKLDETKLDHFMRAVQSCGAGVV